MLDGVVEDGGDGLLDGGHDRVPVALGGPPDDEITVQRVTFVTFLGRAEQFDPLDAVDRLDVGDDPGVVAAHRHSDVADGGQRGLRVAKVRE